MSQTSTSSGASWQGGRGRGWWRGRGGGRYYSHHGNRGRGNSQSQGRGTRMMDDPQPNRRPAPMVQTIIEVQSPYKGWRYYFPEEAYNDHSPTVKKVQVFEKYFLSWSQSYKWDDIEEKGSFVVDMKDLLSDQIIREGIPELSTEMKDMPDRILSCLGLAVHQSFPDQQTFFLVPANGTKVFVNSSKDITCSHIPRIISFLQLITHKRCQEAVLELQTDQSDNNGYSVPIILARVVNYGTQIPLKNLKANYYGKFVSVKGTVVRVSNIKPLCTKLAFECVTCGTIQGITLPDGKYTVPTKCPAQECRAKTFVPKRSSDLTRTIDWQTIRVQEIMVDRQKESGRIPRTIDCELTQDLVDSCVPGDVVTISGIVKVNSVDEGKGRNKDKCMFLLYIYANSVVNAKGNKSGDNSGLAMEFTMKELYAIEEIQSEKNLFRLLVGSLCPSIYGHELVKAGLVLGLFGGSHKFTNDKNRIPVRGDPHILVVGDPGLGKSQMLQSTASIAPRSVYVCGNTTTTSGLTVTLSRDGGSGDFALEAGALVLADLGCCCIDEFDKMGNQHQALLEAMEQQSISIAKAGIVCSLPARTSIIAAANPVGGHYNKAKTVSENLKMGSALLSRFDLVFILLDKPDEEMDCLLSDHVMALHAGQNRGLSVTVRRQRDDSINESILLIESDKPLSDRLRTPRHEPFDPIPHQLLRKYIGYARKYVHPKIGPDAAKVIQEFYLELRKQHQTQDSTPITTRQLESLIRLTEARARLELREVATKEDAGDVIEIMKYSMVDTYTDQFGGLDFKRSQHGSGMSGRSQPKRFIAALQKVSEQTYNSIFTMQQMRQIAKECGVQVLDFEGFISSLNNQGFLLKKGPKVYQLQTADF